MLVYMGGWRVAGFPEEKQERSPRNRNELASEERMLGRRRDQDYGQVRGNQVIKGFKYQNEKFGVNC